MIPLSFMGATFHADTITIAAYVFYNLVYAAASYPMGILADKLSYKKIILLGFALFAIVYGGFAFHPSIAVIFILFSDLWHLCCRNRRSHQSMDY